MMLALFPQGFEERELDAVVELAAYAGSAAEEQVRAAFDEVDAAPVEPGWEDAWRDFHRPVSIGPLWIGPPWERPPVDAVAVVVDPGRAFGTGGHPTTRLSLELLLECPRGSLVDLGCGSGVVAIAAAKLGFERVLALDADPVAVVVARANASVNGVVIDAEIADVLGASLPTCDVAVANIELAVVERLADRLEARRLVASGYLVRDRLEPPGWRHVRRVERDGWAADLLERA